MFHNHNNSFLIPLHPDHNTPPLWWHRMTSCTHGVTNSSSSVSVTLICFQRRLHRMFPSSKNGSSRGIRLCKGFHGNGKRGVPVAVCLSSGMSSILRILEIKQVKMHYDKVSNFKDESWENPKKNGLMQNFIKNSRKWVLIINARHSSIFPVCYSIWANFSLLLIISCNTDTWLCWKNQIDTYVSYSYTVPVVVLLHLGWLTLPTDNQLVSRMWQQLQTKLSARCTNKYTA